MDTNTEQNKQSLAEGRNESETFLPIRCKKIGEVGIEAGSVTLIDSLAVDWGGKSRPIHPGLGRQLLGERNHCEAVELNTGLGDGFYPVFAEIASFGGHLGERVVAIHLLCTPHHSAIGHPDFPDAEAKAAQAEKSFLRFLNDGTF